MERSLSLLQIERVEPSVGARCGRSSKFRHRTRLHVFDKPFAINSNQDVVRVSVGSNVVLCFIHIEALEV